MPYRCSTSRARSASSWLTLASAAPPKIARVLRCPVRPKGCVGIAMPNLLWGSRLQRPSAPYHAPYHLYNQTQGYDQSGAPTRSDLDDLTHEVAVRLTDVMPAQRSVDDHALRGQHPALP